MFFRFPSGLRISRARARVAGLVPLMLLLFFPIQLRADDDSLSIPSAGVQQADDSSFVSPDYQFLPNETVYVTFEIAGFAVKSEEGKENRAISLVWEVSALDSDNIQLAKPESGEIKTELSPEDRKWTPRRRASFVLPALVTAGDCHLHVVVKDLFSKSGAVKDIPFRIGGLKIVPGTGLAAQNVRFSRQEGGQALDIAAYRPGDTVFTSFDITGFAKSPENEYRVSYGFVVLRPDGKAFLDQANAAGMKAAPFYPAKFIPVNLEIVTTPVSPRGEYVVVLTIKDQIANQTFATRRTFTLE